MAKELTLKLMIDPKSNKLIFAEASKDFVDFLIFLLSLPIGTAIKLLTSESMAGSIGNIYASVANLDETYMQPTNKNVVLNPMFFSSVTETPLSIDRSSIVHCGKLYTCDKCKKLITNTYSDAFCSGCHRRMCTEMKFVSNSNLHTAYDSRIGSHDTKGYVKEVVFYMISDDLSVTPMSSTSIVSRMNKFNASKLEEMIVKIGNEEALELLKASFQSTTVLSDVFLKKIKEEEQGNVQEKMQIRVMALSGIFITLEVEFSDTVDNVKTKIQDKNGFPPNQYVLIYGSQLLENGYTLAYYKIQNDCTLLMGQRY